jgi:hypothetical protein
MITDCKARWIANMITHYRHIHISSWNKMWEKKNGSSYRQAAKFTDYDNEKNKGKRAGKKANCKKMYKLFKRKWYHQGALCFT